MKPPYLDVKSAVTLLGASTVVPQAITRALEYAPILVAADGGVRSAVDSGHSPRAVIGDFDSIDPALLAQIPDDRLFHLPEQESTDFDKCLRNIMAPLILAVGFTGGRLDHELAVYNSLLRHPDKRCIVLGEVDLCFLAPETMRLTLPKGTRFSLFPMGQCRVDASGLEWPLKGLEMAPDAKIGTSNRVSADTVSLQVSARKLLVILPRQHLAAVIAGLKANAT